MNAERAIEDEMKEWEKLTAAAESTCGRNENSGEKSKMTSQRFARMLVHR